MASNSTSSMSPMFPTGSPVLLDHQEPPAGLCAIPVDPKRDQTSFGKSTLDTKMDSKKDKIKQGNTSFFFF